MNQLKIEVHHPSEEGSGDRPTQTVTGTSLRGSQSMVPDSMPMSPASAKNKAKGKKKHKKGARPTRETGADITPEGKPELKNERVVL